MAEPERTVPERAVPEKAKAYIQKRSFRHGGIMDYRILLFKDNNYIEIAVQENMALDKTGTITFDGKTVMLNGHEWGVFMACKLAGGVTALLFPKERRHFSTVNIPVLKIGKGSACHIVPAASDVNAVINRGILSIVSGAFFINGTASLPGRYILSDGDTILAGGTEIVYNTRFVSCAGAGYECRLNNYIQEKKLFEGFPEYTRSPRIIKREPTNSVEIQTPPKPEEKKKGQLIKLLMAPLGMLAATVMMGVLMGRGILVLVTAFGTLMTTVISVTNFIEDKRETKRKTEEHAAAYDKYLLKQRKELYSLQQRFLESKRYHNPSIGEIENMVSSYSNRIYERRSNDADFLQFAVGYTECEPSFKAKCRIEEVETNKDPQYLEMAEISKEFEKVKDVPVVVDLKNAHLGIVGESEYIHNQLKAIIAQLTFLQSYHDIEIITVIDEKDKPEFEWIKWYPHCKVKNINVSGLISGENQRDQVLGNVAQVLKSRKQYRDEAKKDSLFLPHYIFIIDNPKLVINHSIMEYLQENELGLGFSVIYTTHLMSNLPENINTIMSLDTNNKGNLLLNEGAYVNNELVTHDVSDVDIESMSRGLAPIKHNKGVSSNIPESITFFEMYSVKHPHELPILKLWKENASHKSMAVPLGVRAKDDIVMLNLHEKSHGPHGLVAGTTGSGKSEILQSYILSLAVNFHPYEVGFLLIDYKGGGMANLFKDLPHLLGTITNLDGSESLRALASIKSELARRQRVFNDHEVNNINQYTKLFKAGKAKEPLPHLFIISDEFAELKKEQPDFMRELISAARIGRSLGVHLILATQKPSGVVDDQIWSNSKFKLALKVQNEADSNEVLKTPDAARITQPGRAILQVGNNEIYEMFQSAWSGAAYSEEKEKAEFDNRVYLVNELGQGVLLNEDLSEGQDAAESNVSQLDATVAAIKQTYDKTKSVPVAKPWLPPLEQQMVSPHVQLDRIFDTGKLEQYDLSVSMGVIDIPEQQKQVEFNHDFINDGNIAIFGASGFGKSTALMNIALSLAVKNSPAALHNYVLDLGNSSLIPLKALPHTADYLSFDDAEKLDKLFRLLIDEIAKRKKLFARENAVNFKMYNTVAKDKLPVIVFYIDNYDVIKEMGPDAEEIITKVTRDGVGLGIFTVITATRVNAVRFAVLNNFKNKIANFMFDVSEIYAIVGRSSYTLPEIRGRAMVKMRDVCIMQEYLPVPFDDEISYANGVRDIISAISAKCTSAAAQGIPMLPEVLEPTALFSAVPKSRARDIVIGLDTENVVPQFMSPTAQVQLIVGSPQTGKTNILKLVMAQYANEAVFLADSRSSDLQHYAENKNVIYMAAPAQAEAFVDKLEEIVEHRKKLFGESAGKQRPKEFYAALPRVAIVIDDVDNFVENCKDCARKLEPLMAEAVATGVFVYATTTPSKLRGYDAVSKLIKETMHSVVTGNPGDQSLVQMPMMRGYKAQPDMAFLCKAGINTLVKVPMI